MKDPIRKYFQVGTIQWMSHPPDQYNVLDSIKTVLCDDYFDAIEITRFADDETRAAAKRLMEQSHIRVCYGAQPRLLGPKLNPNHLDESERMKAEATLMEAIDEAEYLGAKGIAFLAGKWEPERKAESYRQLVKTTSRLCEYASEKGMFVELEVFDYDMDKAALIGPATYAAEFAAEIKKSHENFGLLVDLSHFPTTYESSEYAISVMKEFITHLHIGNAVVKKGYEAYGDMHPRFGFPDSANDTETLLDFFRVLKKHGFMREDNPLVLSLEVKPWNDEDGDIILANTKRVINRAWALLED